MWIIPLSSGSTSIGIVADNEHHPLNTYNSIEKAMEWLQQYEPHCALNISSYLDRLQDFRFLQNFSHGCKQVFSDERWFLTGEAGVFLDPFYSPGSDLIAISNTFVTNIIEADYKGDKVQGIAEYLVFVLVNSVRICTNVLIESIENIDHPAHFLPFVICFDNTSNESVADRDKVASGRVKRI